MGKKKITIAPISRLEGHGKIEIFLNDEGNVDNAFFQVVELRGFEKFCQGRPIEEMPRITTRFCGVCPWAHHIASTKAMDAVFKVKPTETATLLRELGYMAHYVHSHAAHFYALAGPDFVVGPTAPKAERNIVGVIGKVGLEIGGAVIKNRGYAQDIQEMVGGKATHPVYGLPGGVSKGINEDQRKKIEEMGKSLVEFGKLSLQIFDDIVLKNKEYVDLITGDIYKHNTYYMGTVDNNNKLALYDGKIKVIDPDGVEFAKFEAKDYLEHIAEHVEPWSYLKFAYLKKIGWKGFEDGKDSSIYRVAPLARMNVCDGISTPLAQEAYEKMFDILGKPSHATLANNWARLIEMMYAAERLMELVENPAITGKDIRNIPTDTPGEGIGSVEAPRGTLYHHYISDEEGITKKVNFLVATGNNNAAMCMSVKKAAEKLIKNGNVNDGLLNMVEMAFRAYDPCLACATHLINGHMPLEVKVKDYHGNQLYRFSNL